MKATSRRSVLTGLAAAPFVGGGMPLPGLPHEPSDGQDVLIRGADTVLTMDPALGRGPLGELRDADVLLRKGRVHAVGHGLDRPVGARTVSAGGKLVLPGFVDIHNHLWQSGFRGGCSGQDLDGWLRNCHQPVFAELTSHDLYWCVLLSCADVLQSGVTTVVDWVAPLSYPRSAKYLCALERSGLRFVFAAAQNAADLPLLRRLDRELLRPSPLGSLQVAGSAAMFMLPDLRASYDMARELGVMFNLHLLERADQRRGEPVRALREAGALGPDVLANHAVHLTPEEISLLARHDVRTAYCPLSNMRLGSGVMPLPALHRHGVKTGLGQDGAANDSSDYFALMKTAVGLQRAVHQRADVYPGIADILRTATLGGAEAIGMDHLIGSLTPGKRADALVISPRALNFAPEYDRVAQIVLNGQPANVTHVFVDGVEVKSDGRLVRLDVPRILSEADRTARRLRAARQSRTTAQPREGRPVPGLRPGV